MHDSSIYRCTCLQKSSVWAVLDLMPDAEKSFSIVVISSTYLEAGSGIEPLCKAYETFGQPLAQPASESVRLPIHQFGPRTELLPCPYARNAQHPGVRSLIA